MNPEDFEVSVPVKVTVISDRLRQFAIAFDVVSCDKGFCTLKIGSDGQRLTVEPGMTIILTGPLPQKAEA